MARYVTSTRGNATLAHIGNARGTTLCGVRFTATFYVSPTCPKDRTLCRRCRAALVARPDNKAQRARSVEARDALLVSLLRDGATDAALRRRLHAGRRTVSRYVNDAMRRAGARSRFQWGYLVGLAEGREQ